MSGTHQEPAAGYRLSLQQRRLWAVWGETPARAEVVVRLLGPLDGEALRRSLADAVARHEILRTDFRRVPGMSLPVQVVGSAAAEDGLRSTLDVCGPEDHLLTLSLPVLGADAPALALLVDEIAAGYAARRGRGEAPAQEPTQYADFSAWQSEWLAGEESVEGRAWWRRRDAADLRPSAPPWGEKEEAGPLAGPLPGVESDGPPLAEVEAVAAGCGVSAADLLLASWQALLWRLTGSSPVVVGLAADGRVYEELEGALGPLSRHLPVATRPAAETPFRELAKATGEAVQDVSLWQEHYVWEERDEAGAAFPLVFDFLPRPGEREAAGLRFVVESLDAPAEPCRLGLFCRLSEGDRLRLRVQYDPRFYGETDARRVLHHLRALLGHALASPRTPLAELEVLDAEERRRILEGFNQTARPVREGLLLHQLFEQQAARAPRAVALVHSGGELTYGELNARANRLARELRARGVGAETRVAVAVERSPEMVVAVLGVLKAGGAWVPLDVEAPAARNAYVLADSGARLALARDRGQIPPDVEVLAVDGPGPLDAADPEPVSDPDSLAYVAYTSGSSGRPKGVLGTHRGAVNYLGFILRAFALEPEDLVLQVAGLPFDAWIRDCLGPLAAGARVLLLDPAEAKDPAALLSHLRGGAVTRALSLVPSLLRAVLAAAPGPAAGGGSLRTVVASGEAVHGRDLREVRRLLGDGVELVNFYGPTECTMTSTFRQCLETDLEAGRLPVGRPLDNVRCFVLDERLEPVPAGVVGEICVAGAGLTRGYSGSPDLAAAGFVPNPHGTPGERLYRTGDLGRYRGDGVLEVLGRRDHQVKVRGVRVELGEVESALRRHPAVQETVVVLRQDEMVAYVVASQAPGPDSVELRSFLRESLPEPMLPGAFVTLQALPRTANGKVDRAALPEPGRVRQTAVAADPRTPVEEILAGIWEEVLGVERVSPGDDFFDLGGHSLVATQVVARAQSAFGVRLPLRTLFDHPTLERLALVVEEAMERGTPVPRLEPVDRRGRLPLSFAQRRLWFLQRLDPVGTAYNRPHALRIGGAFAPGVMERCLDEIVRRHEVLRTTFGVENGEPFQVVHPYHPRPLPLVDLTALSAAPQEAETLRLVAGQGTQPFDLESDPMMRACLLRRSEAEHVLLLTLHHIAGDGWSTGVLVRETSVLYKAFLAGEPSPLPELPVQYGDFACHQRRVLDEAAVEEELRYWRLQLGERPPRTRLRPDQPPATARQRLAARSGVSVPDEVGEAVRAFSRQAGVTPFMTLLAAFKLLLLRYTGQADLTVLSPVANRDQHEVEGLVGFFVNMLPLRTDLSGNPTFRELVERVRQVALGAYSHRTLPFEVLIDRLKWGGSGESPLQIVFALQTMPPPALDLPGVTLDLLPVNAEAAKFDLILGMVDQRVRFGGPVFYRSDLFSDGYIHRMLDHYRDLLGQAVTQPDLRLLDFSLADGEREEPHAALGLEESYAALEFNF